MKSTISKARYLILVHFAAKLTRNDLVAVATEIVESVRRNFEYTESIATSEAMVGMVGISATDPAELFKALAGVLRRGDNLSILTLGRDIVTSHPGLHSWVTVSRQT